MSALPKAVQKQIEEANRLAEQLNNERLGLITSKPDDQVPDSGNTPAATAPDVDQPPPADQPPADGDQSTASAPAPASAAEGWEQKYRVLQGKYNAEVPRLQRQLQEQNSTLEQLKAQLTATQGMLSALAQNRVAAPGGQGTAPAAPAKLVKDEEVKEFGEDLTDFIKRVAQEAVLPAVEQKLQPVQQQVAEVRQTATKVAERSVQSDHERLLATLDQQIAGWRQQNSDPGFLDWLAQPDSYSGLIRGDLLKQAYESFDVPRIVAFFKGYRNEHAVVTPPATAAAPNTSDASQRKLDDFVAPGTPKAGTTGAQDGAGKRIWTQAEIKRFYDDCAAGKYRNNLERRKQIEQDIFAAGREGRVR